VFRQRLPQVVATEFTLECVVLSQTSSRVALPTEHLKSDSFYLFTAAAAQSPAFIRYEEFETSLYSNLLLNPSQLIISDPFFTSTFLSKYFKQHSSWTKSVFERALQDKLIIPFTRYSYIDNFREIIRAQAHIGNPKGRENLERLNELDQTLIRWDVHWPEGMGLKFKDLVQARFLRSSQSRFLNKFTEIVEKMPSGAAHDLAARFRGDMDLYCEFIYEALKAHDEAEGLRMSDIYFVVSRHYLGTRELAEGVEIKSIIEAIRASRGSILASQTFLFFKILSDLYFENMASGVKAARSIHHLDALQEIFSSRAFVSDEIPEAIYPPMVVDIKLPSNLAIREVSYDTFYEIRKSDQFNEFRNAFLSWSTTPRTSNKASRLLSAISNYADRICSLVDKDLTDHQAKLGPYSEFFQSFIPFVALSYLVAESDAIEWIVNSTGFSRHWITLAGVSAEGVMAIYPVHRLSAKLKRRGEQFFNVGRHRRKNIAVTMRPGRMELIDRSEPEVPPKDDDQC
jgi:hypothetical protein